MAIPPPTERQMRVIWLALTGLAVAVLVALVAGLIWGLGQVLRILAPVLWPLAVAGVVAYLLDPVVNFFERKGASRPRAILSVFGLALVIVSALFGTIIPPIVTEASQLADQIPTYAVKVEARLSHWLSHPPPWVEKLLERTGATPTQPLPAATNLPPQTFSANATGSVGISAASTNAPSLIGGGIAKEDFEAAAGWAVGAARGAGSWLGSRVVAWFGLLAGLALIPVYSFYFLLEKRGISSRWTDYLPVTDSRFKDELVFVLNSINNYLIAFFRGQVLVAICDGTLYGIGFLIIGLPYALLIGAMAMFLTMIPFLGASITCGAALIIALVQYGDWLHPLLVLAVFGFVQALEGLVISPKIMGGRVGLHPVTIIIAVMAGTTLLGGLLGGILAIPLTAALRVVMFRYVWKRPGRI